MEGQPCPYEGCICTEVSYWGWYERKEGCLPLDGGTSAAGAIPIRRFRCSGCGRTFSWRPPFLVFGRRYAAVFYQMALREWCLGRRGADGRAWYEPGPTGRRAFFRLLTRRFGFLLGRLGEAREGLPPHDRADSEERRSLWNLARGSARDPRDRQDRSRLAIHPLCMALAQAFGTLYRLEAC